MKRFSERAAALLLTLILLLAPAPAAAAASVGTDDMRAAADGIIAWKKADNGSEPGGDLINNAFLELAGTTPGDWFPIGMSRLGVTDDYDGYLAFLRQKVEKRYVTKDKLSRAKATEWHRISLAVLAAGGDPTSFGKNADGSAIDLIADGTYDRGRTAPLGRQGINGWIWGLIALDSMRYPVPDGAFYTRDDLITAILSQQLCDGGFALTGSAADPDITAMAVQALAPYYNEEKSYSYTLKADGTAREATVRQAVDAALTVLSALQLDTGDFISWGTQNVESTCQVAVALCSLGIDPASDSRFIKNGNTLIDGIMRYRHESGGFVHSYTYDPDNPASLPDKPNSMASEQVLYTIAAILRQANGMRTLYDFRPEMSDAMKERIRSLTDSVSALSPTAGKEEISALLGVFYALPADERCYVPSYAVLSDAAKAAGIDIAAVAGATTVVEDTDKSGTDESILYFSPTDRADADAIPDEPTTADYVTVVKLLDKLERSDDFDGKDGYISRLTDAKNKIDAIRAEIDAINRDIAEELYPFESIGLSDKKTVDGIYRRVMALAEPDRALIEHSEDLIKTKTKTDGLFRALIIGAVLAVIALAVAFMLVRRIRKRRRKKKAEMDELERSWADEP
mgnify:FL=1